MNTNILDEIKQHLIDHFKPQHIELADESSAHVGHAGFSTNQLHLRLHMSSELFINKTQLSCHRLVYEVLKPYAERIHALSLHLSPTNPNR